MLSERCPRLHLHTATNDAALFDLCAVASYPVAIGSTIVCLPTYTGAHLKLLLFRSYGGSANHFERPKYIRKGCEIAITPNCLIVRIKPMLW
jgi:hypothetical protein